MGENVWRHSEKSAWPEQIRGPMAQRIAPEAWHALADACRVIASIFDGYGEMATSVRAHRMTAEANRTAAGEKFHKVAHEALTLCLGDTEREEAIAQIAEKFEVTEDYVSRCLQSAEHDWKVDQQKQKIERALKMSARGETDKAIGAALGISRQAAAKFVARHTPAPPPAKETPKTEVINPSDQKAIQTAPTNHLWR